jgi:hypothetical protein
LPYFKHGATCQCQYVPVRARLEALLQRLLLEA